MPTCVRGAELHSLVLCYIYMLITIFVLLQFHENASGNKHQEQHKF
jgi:hypothetical protein